jgi:hypothetical protein
MKNFLSIILLCLVTILILSCASNNINSDKIKDRYTLQKYNELGNRDRWDLTDFSESIVVLLLTGNIEEIHNRLDHRWKQTINKDKFNRNIELIVANVNKAKRVILEDAMVLKFRFNAPEKPMYLFFDSTYSESQRPDVFYAVPGIKKQALVLFRIKHKTMEKLLFLRLGYFSNGYRLTGVAISSREITEHI